MAKGKQYGGGRVFRHPGRKVWWIAYYRNGSEHRESSGSHRERDAVTLLRQRIGDKASGRPFTLHAERTTFEDMVAMLEHDYRVNCRKSISRAKQAAAHLRETFGGDRAVDITTDRLMAYTAARLDEGAKPATVHMECTILKRMFNLALQARKVLAKPHIPSLKLDNVRQGFFEQADLCRVLDELPEHMRPVVRFAALTGWRIGEVLGLEWRQVDFTAGVVRLEPGTTKNGRGRVFPFGPFPELEELLRAQLGRVVKPVFHLDGEAVRYDQLHREWDRACARAGVPKKHLHDLRRTAVRALERAGVSRSVAMQLTGHQTESVFRRYAIVDEQDLAVGVAKLSAAHSTQAEQKAGR
jgi:integrase